MTLKQLKNLGDIKILRYSHLFSLGLLAITRLT
jgi:hypothetical protein